MTKLEFIKLANDQRKANKHRWVFLSESVGSNLVQYKAYNTWVQILSINGIKDSSPMDISVKQFNDFLINAIPE